VSCSGNFTASRAGNQDKVVFVPFQESISQLARLVEAEIPEPSPRNRRSKKTAPGQGLMGGQTLPLFAARGERRAGVGRRSAGWL
jgi:hypothetical protein